LFGQDGTPNGEPPSGKDESANYQIDTLLAVDPSSIGAAISPQLFLRFNTLSISPCCFPIHELL
jgi:hypothetical protein